MTANDLARSWTTALAEQSNVQIDSSVESALAEIIGEECDKWMGYDVDTVATVDRLGPDLMGEVPVPDWVPQEDGYKASTAMRIGKKNKNCAIVVTYSPTKTLGIGFSKVFIVESKTNQPFPRMKEMWEVLSKRADEFKKSNPQKSNGLLVPLHSSYSNYPLISTYPSGYSLPSNVTISKTGELRSAFGSPKPIETYGVAVELNSLYREWRHFPDETDYEMVGKLKEAKEKVAAMEYGARDCEIEINNARNSIKEYQKHISDVEAKMNKLYEDAAEAMDLLEAHGIKMDLEEEKKKSDSWYVDDDDNPMLSDIISVPYEDAGQFITVSKSDRNSICTISSY